MNEGEIGAAPRPPRRKVGCLSLLVVAFGLLEIFVAVGAFLPREYEATREIVIEAPRRPSISTSSGSPSSWPSPSWRRSSMRPSRASGAWPRRTRAELHLSLIHI